MIRKQEGVRAAKLEVNRMDPHSYIPRFPVVVVAGGGGGGSVVTAGFAAAPASAAEGVKAVPEVRDGEGEDEVLLVVVAAAA